MKVYFLITIDTECDKGPKWVIKKPLEFRSIKEGIPETLTPLFERFELIPTYLLSPEVILNDQSVSILESLERVELGTHLHGEFLEPFSDFDTNRTSTPQLFYEPDVEYQKLKNLTQLFESRFKYSPTSFRAGRWGLSIKTLGFLQELGYIVDSSISPFRTHYFDQNRYVNFWGTPLQPYHPSPNDYRREGKMKLLEVPATLGNPSLMRLPHFILRQFNDKSKIHKKVLGKLGKSSKIIMLRPYRSSAEEMIKISESYIKTFRRKSDTIFLNMMFHSNELVPGASPYVQTAADLEKYLNSLKFLFDALKTKYGIIGSGLSEVGNVWSQGEKNQN